MRCVRARDGGESVRARDAARCHPAHRREETFKRTLFWNFVVNVATDDKRALLRGVMS